MFSAATPVLLIQGEGKVRLVEMVGINKSSYPRYSESLEKSQMIDIRQPLADITTNNFQSRLTLLV